MSKANLWKVIGASSVGTMIEWYDFYIFGSLASILSEKFFPSTNPTAAFMATLATFAAGFVVRPFGALVFGRLGDLIGRKHTFMLTLLLMGGATFLIGCIPSYESIGVLAPLLVLILRLIQGLALGGEYGGAATYVAEHAPKNRRGFWTSWIQTTATVGLFISLLVIMLTRLCLTKESFHEWGWRIPFWVSIVMILISYVIRKNMDESPVFKALKASGNTVKNPLRESFAKRENFKVVLLALFGATMGQGVIWYTGQFYAMSFLEKVCLVEKMQSDTIMTIALVLGTPLFLLFGYLSDLFGRKTFLMLGMLLAILLYRPIYEKIHSICIPNTQPTTVIYTKNKVTEIDSTYHYSNGLIENYSTKATKHKTEVKIQRSLPPSKKWQLIGLIFIQLIFVTMVYGPIAAFLVELFPSKIRYTSMSLPYHIGNGIFGGLLPAIATYLTTHSNSNTPYLDGLWYPIIIGTVCLIIGFLYINPKTLKNHE